MITEEKLTKSTIALADIWGTIMALRDDGALDVLADSPAVGDTLNDYAKAIRTMCDNNPILINRMIEELRARGAVI